MVESTGFENLHTRKGIGGSNPPVSAGHYISILGGLAEWFMALVLKTSGRKPS